LAIKVFEALDSMDREKFESLVRKAVAKLPEEFVSKLSNVDVVVEHRPSRGQVARAGLGRGETLLGLYEGVPQTRRGAHYGLVPPDRITIFQRILYLLVQIIMVGESVPISNSTTQKLIIYSSGLTRPIISLIV